MSELQTIETALAEAARRRRWARALRGLWTGLIIGAVLSLLLTGAYHLFPLPIWILPVAALIPLPCLVVGSIVGGWRKSSMAEVARWVDSRQQLKERLSTALEMAANPVAGSWRDIVVVDAARHAEQIDPKSLLPFHLPKSVKWSIAVLALVAGLGFVPEYRSKAYLQKKNDQEVIKETGRQLADLTRRSLEKRVPTLEPTQKSMEAVKELGDQLAKKSLTRSDALKDLANVADKLKEQIKEMGKDPALKKLEQAARHAGGNDSQPASGLQKQIDSLQKQLGMPTGNPDAIDRIKKELEKLEQAAKGLADKNSAGAEAARQKLSESLAALSKQAQEMGLQLPQLDEAINALAANQTDMVLKDLHEATLDLEKMREMAKSLQQLQQQTEKLGKDLAEQLKNGQPEAAQQTLQKMISQLRQANLSPEQMQKIFGEVAKAVSPAENYGKASEHLNSAVKQMKGNDRPGAAQSLAAAAKELENLMQQLGDAQELQATLDAMNQASMCIACGKGWQVGKGPPKAGRGGRPGSGVGTWAEEGAQWDGITTAGWDNSSVVRSDEDARGHTDRGPGELNEALQPTKVKGQFSPGGQMPSITLRGVSIKGQSKVNYEEATTAAQADAQSALSHDQVPRAYQGSVREYFDDLKK